MITNIIKFLALLTWLLFLCTCDILSYFFIEHHFCYLVRSFLITYYWYYESPLVLGSSLLLLIIESFTIYESLTFSLLGVLPVLALTKILKNRMYSSPMQPVISFLIALIFDPLLSKIFMKSAAIPPTFYTANWLFANIVIVLLFSLKLHGGKKRQSLMPLA